jgi:hypothetical protein
MMWYLIAWLVLIALLIGANRNFWNWQKSKEKK